MEAKKISDWNVKMAKIEETSRKKDELDAEFKMQTMEALSFKMENSEEKREAIISDLKEKLKVIFDLIKTRVDGNGKEEEKNVSLNTLFLPAAGSRRRDQT